MTQATTFMAAHDNSKWEAQTSKLVCHLNHEIPGYGEGIFEQRSGERQTFALKATMGRLIQGDIRISLSKPSWARSKQTQPLARVSAQTGLTPIKLTKMTVYQILDNLDKGFLTNFDFKPANTSTNKQSQSQDRIALSPTNFHGAYQDYLACVEQLVPYTFQDLKKSIIRFNSASKALSVETEQKLNHIAEFVNNDTGIYKIKIEGHTDSVGSFTANRRLSYERAWFIKDYLVDQGVSPDLIKIKGLGDRKPLAKNKTAKGRAKNRRVEVLLYR